MKCKRCHRPLKKPESIELGYGATCAKKEGISITKKFKKNAKLIKSKDLFEF